MSVWESWIRFGGIRMRKLTLLIVLSMALLVLAGVTALADGIGSSW